MTHPDVDVIHLATPPHLREEFAVAAANAGKQIFCEKPLALTLDAADAMLLTAQQRQVKIGINYVMRYAQLYELLDTIIGEGLLGAPQRVAFENLAGDLPAGHWFWNPQLSGGILVEHGVHFFDMFTHLLGQGKLQWTACDRRDSGEEDKWLVMLRHREHVFSTFYHAFNKPSAVEQTTCLIDFERGQVVLEGWIPERMHCDGVVTAVAAGRLQPVAPRGNRAPAAPFSSCRAGKWATASRGFPRHRVDFSGAEAGDLCASRA